MEEPVWRLPISTMMSPIIHWSSDKIQMWHTREKHCVIYFRMEKTRTQRLFASEVCFKASTNWSIEGDAIHILSAPIFMRMAFCSGRNSSRLPFSFLYALVPSNSPYFWISRNIVMYALFTFFNNKYSPSLLIRTKKPFVLLNKNTFVSFFKSDSIFIYFLIFF